MKKLSAALLLTPTAALAHTGAHTGHAGGAPLVAGLSHPLGGADHLLAMVAVGLWAAGIGGRAVWALPLAFVAAMVAGGGLGAAGSTCRWSSRRSWPRPSSSGRRSRWPCGRAWPWRCR